MSSKITRLLAFVGEKGIAGFRNDNGEWFPMVVTNETPGEVVGALRLTAQKMADLTGETLELREYALEDILATFPPKGRN